MCKRIPVAVLFFLLLPAAFFITAMGWRVDSLELLDDSQRVLFSVPVALGQRFTTTYIHSVELTPVEDEYIVLGGKIWTWQERVKSSNAGMPCFKPDNGCYINTKDWLIFQGGRQSWDHYYLRVGNKTFGLNKMELAPFGTTCLFKIFPGKRITVAVKSGPMLFAELYQTEVLYKPLPQQRIFSAYK
ncbi:DUF1850 domain-containing protein [Cloacibacillus porcorum]|uniref:DUF1850 domain-containing protein n=1 Tax=Cloacibacillus porcorum TaxID=1197717 RepID=A0A1B2I729_9BACT|nr:DUF1850 domain-containing protein [Cloacibacillus porcorum]ANZ45779.1 hypothetical protein BED41_12220 [Cloacibacillus porcorum]